MKEELGLLPEYLAAHLALTLGALALGSAVSVPAGIAVTRSGRLEQPVLGLASVVQTVPSLALLAFMVPALAAFGMPSIGTLPALIGLSLYSLLPILRNTVVGLRSIDPALVEAADGVGMTPRERLLRVELPLAMPVIVAGVRTSAVWTVGTATLATPIGAPSLGNYIFGGLQTRNYGAIMVGCAAAAALALLLDGLVRLLEVGLRKRRRSVIGAAAAAFAILAVIAVVPSFKARAASPITVGAKTFTEQYVLSRILAEVVRRENKVSARTVESLGSMVVFDALRESQIDTYVDYSGTLWTTVLKRTDLPTERGEVLREVKTVLERDYGVIVAATLGFENTYALAVRGSDADRLGIRRVSDLAVHAPSMVMGADYELFQRAEWRSIERAYGLTFRELRTMDPSLMYDAVKSGGVDVVSAYSTDGRIAAFGLRVLDDDRGAIPPYDAVVLVSPRLARERPDVVRALRSLEGTIDAARMRRMNQAVDEHERSLAAVAEGFFDGHF